MAAGGFREFVAGETLDEDKINDFLMQGMLVFADATARDAAITSPVEGQFAFLKSDDSVSFYDGSDWVALAESPFTVDFLVAAGGGGGGFSLAGGGGAGNAVTGSFTMAGSATLAVIVGAGGAGKTDAGGTGAVGSPSQFFLVRPVGGGGGGVVTPCRARRAHRAVAVGATVLGLELLSQNREMMVRLRLALTMVVVVAVRVLRALVPMVALALLLR
jgi:hypothetical protein